MLSVRGIDPDTATCLELLHQALPNEFMIMYQAGMPVQVGRSVSATRYMNDYGGKFSAPYLVFIDDDQTFYPKDIVKLLEHLQGGKRLIGALYPTRNGAMLTSSNIGTWGENLNDISIDGGVQEVAVLANGFMGIAKSLLVDIKDKLELPLLDKGTRQECYPFFLYSYGKNRLGEDVVIGEDWEFCRKANAIGEKAYVDADIRIGHIGRKLYSVDDVIQSQASAQRK
jgi:hypothetical protein